MGKASAAGKYLMAVAIAMGLILITSYFPPSGNLGERAQSSFIQALIIVLVPVILLWLIGREKR